MYVLPTVSGTLFHQDFKDLPFTYSYWLYQYEPPSPSSSTGLDGLWFWILWNRNFIHHNQVFIIYLVTLTYLGPLFISMYILDPYTTSTVLFTSLCYLISFDTTIEITVVYTLFYFTLWIKCTYCFYLRYNLFWIYTVPSGVLKSFFYVLILCNPLLKYLFWFFWVFPFLTI